MVVFSFILSILLIISTGFLFFSLVTNKSNDFTILEILPISLGLGSGLISLWMFLTSFLGISFTLISLLLPTLLCLLIFIRRKKWGIINIKSFFPVRLSAIELILLCLITFNLALVYMNAYSFPFIGWDEWCNWGFKSRLFFEDGLVTGASFKEYGANIPRPDQPLSLYLMLCYVYKFLGHVSEEYSRVFFSLFYPALLIILFYALRRKVRRITSLIITFLVSSTPIIMRFSSMAYGDVAFAFYLLSTVIYLYLFFETNKKNFLVIGTLLLSMGLWTKGEGILLWLTLFIVFLIHALYKITIKRNFEIKPKLFLGLLLSLAYIIPWKIFVSVNKLPNQHLVEGNLGLIFTEFKDRLLLISQFIFTEIFKISEWNIFWILFFITIFYLFGARRKYILFLCIFFVQFLFFTFVYFSWPQDISTLFSVFYATFPRLLLQITPIAAVFIGWQFEEVNERK